jgi:diguanylate cyclase (GGDEF)-like protein
VRNGPDRTEYVIGLFEDVTETRIAKERIHYLASFDQATGLPTFVMFEERADAALMRSRSQGRNGAVLAVAFDRLAPIRFTLTRERADRLVRRLADRIRRALGPDDILGRIGDALFAIVLPGLDDAEEAVATVKSIIASFAAPLEIDHQDYLVPPTIGISLFPDDAETAAELIRNAGAALQRARDQGTSRFEMYDPDIGSSTVARLTLETRLRRAIDRNAFELLYQPQVEVDSLTLGGFEALVRWRDEDGTLIPPSEFIPLAEETGLIVPLGEAVLRIACQQAMTWRHHRLLDVPVSVNLSGRQIGDPLLTRKVLSVLAESGLPPSCLKLEMTETALFRSTPAIRSALLELHDAGIRFMLDDFGTGYSSLSYLKRFPIDAIKIDKSFVQSMVQEPDAASIVHAIINMAHALKMQVVAEGVETQDQLLFLRAYRCDRMQGYLFARPMTADDAGALLARSRPGR